MENPGSVSREIPIGGGGGTAYSLSFDSGWTIPSPTIQITLYGGAERVIHRLVFM